MSAVEMIEHSRWHQGVRWYRCPEHGNLGHDAFHGILWAVTCWQCGRVGVAVQPTCPWEYLHE